ncbi:MAG TPA: DUF1882 domain-containing protein [Campylobacterales bacterium]|nr:DUF1882 domain-containing protein [Campylobacterales bacterium]
MKVTIFDLEFDSECCYIQKNSIVEKITFNNRTLYSKFKKIETPPTDILIHQHLNRELTLALPLVENGVVNYLVLEYEKEKSDYFYHLIKHLLKSLHLNNFFTYSGSKENMVQIFIPRESLSIEDAYQETEKIETMLEMKSSKRCKILPTQNLPKFYNIVTLPTQKM